MTTCAPVATPPGLALDLLGATVRRFGPRRGLRLVHCRGLRRAGRAPAVLCPCDHGPGNCKSVVPVHGHRFRLEGWLLVELLAGQCPHCRRVYWG
jgi:hypothetical protein